MNYTETLSYIHSLGMFSRPASLERIRAVLAALSDPQKKFKAIHIAGTNGKGSVSCFIASVFEKAGYKTGLFTSPYIIDFRERIQINGEFISEAELTRLSARVTETDIALTEFEFITAVGFLYFAEQHCDIVIAEAGLGGRLDATNALEPPLVTVITKIGLDHTSVLGGTVEKIAAEKCGIIKGGVTVTSPSQPDGALSVIRECASRLVIPDVDTVTLSEAGITGNEYTYKNKKFKTRLAGAHQIENSLVAIETVRHSGFDISYDIIYEGIAAASLPARLEIISECPLTVLDGAHNPDGAAALSEFMKHTEGITAVIGMMRDKDCDGALSLTLPHCTSAVTVEVAGNSRSHTADSLALEAEKYCKNVFVAKSYKEALEIASGAADGGAVFVFGSLYLASAIRPLLKDFR